MAMTYETLKAYIDGLYADGVMSEQDYNDVILYILANGDLANSPRDLIQVRRGEIANIPNLAQGELAYTFDTEELYIGGINGNVSIGKGNFVSAKRFGVKGDGVTDDTVKMQEFIDYVCANGLLGVIPSGTYVCGQLTYRTPVNGFTIMGENKETTIIKANDLLNRLDFRNCDGVNIMNLTLDMNTVAPTTGGTGLYFVDCNNVNVDNVDIINVGYGSILSYTTDPMNKQTENMNFRNVKILCVGATTDNVHPTGLLLADVDGGTIDNIYVEGCQYYPLEFKNKSENINVSNIRLKNCFHGIYLGGDAVLQDGFYARNINYTNIICENVYQPLWFGTAKGIRVSGFNSYHTNNPVTAYGAEIRNCDNVEIINAIFNYAGATNGFSVRDSDMVTIKASAYRMSGTGRIVTLPNTTNTIITIDYTNVLFSTYADVPATCQLIYSDGRVVVNKDIRNASNDGGGISEIFDNGTSSIQVLYDPSVQRVRFIFTNGEAYIDNLGIHAI
jgi:hypothetical protein